MSRPLKEVIHGSATLLKLAEKPLGIGLGIGLSVGAINTYFLGIPLLLTLSSGAILGLIVCLIAAPGMKSELRARREAEARRKAMLRAKARTASAFTAFE
ncbi:MAG: hypothetical protein VXY11_01430 [Candidatus Thermoplasmatota archaeon]|nr:hypothetical protein [Candidatus Thermoplasmatota archaeon]GIR66854.1 MAG: hypothetical protein CM15mP71_0800 [Candidatus Poseidoniales archaeon]